MYLRVFLDRRVVDNVCLDRDQFYSFRFWAYLAPDAFRASYGRFHGILGRIL